MKFGILRASAADIYLAVVVAALAIMAPQSVRAQDLVQNPDFTNGLTGYVTSGSVTTQPLNGTHIAFFGGANSSLSQEIATVPGGVYTFTFMAAFDPGIADTALASFGTGSLPFSFAAGQASGSPAQYSFSATATGTLTNLAFSNNTGESYIEFLDLQAAPAPVLGAGGYSFLAGLAWLVGARLLRRRRALA